MCVNNLSKVALDNAAAGIEPATSSRKSNALTTAPPSHTKLGLTRVTGTLESEDQVSFKSQCLSIKHASAIIWDQKDSLKVMKMWKAIRGHKMSQILSYLCPRFYAEFFWAVGKPIFEGVNAPNTPESDKPGAWSLGRTTVSGANTPQ